MKQLQVLLIICILGICTSTVQAETFDSFIGLPLGPVTNADYGQVGFGFYGTDGPVRINRIGYYDAGNDGLSAAHDVGLYKHVGGSLPYELIAKATIPAATEATLADGYRWVSIPDIAILPSPAAGDYYILIASGDAGDPRNEPVVEGLPYNTDFGMLTGDSFYVNEPFDKVGSFRSFSSNMSLGTGGYSGGNLGCLEATEISDGISNGRRIILEKGVQLAAYGYFREPDSQLNISRYLDADYTMVEGYVDPSVLEQLPEGAFFGSRVELGEVATWNDVWYPKYAAQMTSINLEDEPGPNSHPGTLPVLNRLPEIKQRFENFRVCYPDALTYISSGSLDEYTTDPSGTGGNEIGLRTYMQGARPDMLMYSNYPAYSFPAVDREWWYRIMGSFRRVGLEGYDGTGAEPIPYGQYMSMLRPSYTAPVPCESYVRLQRFGSLAFGFTYLEDWTYARGGDISVMFSMADDSDPTEVYHYVAGGTFEGNTYSGVNREIKNLSPALSRLVSTDVRIICGTNTSQVPLGISTWSARTADTGDYSDYITGITPLGRPGITSDYSDVLIGYFEPLLNDNSDCTFVDGLLFMVVNGAAGNEVTVDANGVSNSIEVASGLASAWEEAYHITFDFSGSDFDSLVRLSRDTGEVELVTLPHISGSEYYLDLLLPGGTGDLFAFWDSSDPLPFVSEPELIAGDANGDGKVDGSDVTILAGNWQHGVTGTPNASWSEGDFNGDGKVDGSDVTILAGNWQYGVTVVAAVPEPSTLALLTAGLLGLLCHVWQKQK